MARRLLLGFGLRLLKAGVDFPLSRYRVSSFRRTENAHINMLDVLEILSEAFTEREGRLLAGWGFVTSMLTL